MKEFIAAAGISLPNTAVLPGDPLESGPCRHMAAGGMASGRGMVGRSHEEGRQRGASWAIGETDGEELSGRCRGGHEESGHSGGVWPAARREKGCICNCWCLDSGISCVFI